MERQEDFLRAIARRPFERSLRLVFADWLLEQGDPRGEVIALSERGALSLSERTRLRSLTEQHRGAWLGPLTAVADPDHCRFERGFLAHLVCRTPAGRGDWLKVRDDPRLATVRRLVLPLGVPAPEQGAFLRSGTLQAVTCLHAPAGTWALLAGPPPPAFTLDAVGLASVGVFEGELEVLDRLAPHPAARRLDLISSEFVNVEVADQLRASVLAQRPPVRRFQELRLAIRYGNLEGAARWLVRGATEPLPGWRSGERWSVELQDVRFVLHRKGGSFVHLEVDLVGQDEQRGLDWGIPAAASVLVQLKPAGLRSVELTLPAGARLRASERDALRAAARRLGTIKALTLQGQALTP